MLMTICYKGEHATDLGYLLHKNPDRPQEFELSYGRAYVFYPEATDQSTTVALLLRLNPIDLARGKAGSKEGGLFDYVNDRPYVASSFLSTAISEVFGSALSGKCAKKPELVETPLSLTATVSMLPVCGNKELVNRLFEPLGYTVEMTTFPVDAKFPAWGEADYVNLKISAMVTLSQLLKHLYVLIPVFDLQKHYWISDDEVDKLLKHGEGWLARHPEREDVARRYFNKNRKLTDLALARIAAEEAEEETEGAPPEIHRISLNGQRLSAVLEMVKKLEAKRVMDLGCGEGKLISLLMKEAGIEMILGMDVSLRVLGRAKDSLHYDGMSEYQRNKLTLIQGSLTYCDDRLKGFDVACVTEVIEHLDETRLSAFERALFECAAPTHAIITTPNIEYNAKYERMNPDALRHGDHRFEWTRAQFRMWASAVCERYPYSAQFFPVGDTDEELGAPTQMGVFTKCE